VFSRAIPIYTLASVEPDWWVQMFKAAGGTTPNAMPLSTNRRSEHYDRFEVRPPRVPRLPPPTDSFSVQIFDSEPGSTACKVEAFDAQGHVIYSTTPTTPASSAVTVKISKSGIARVRLTDTGDGCEIDNISFNAPTNNAASIAGTLWHDLDGDKIIDTGEPKLSGWTRLPR